MKGLSKASGCNSSKRCMVKWYIKRAFSNATCLPPLHFGIASTVSVSYVEVYGQEMTDLLRGGALVAGVTSTSSLVFFFFFFSFAAP